MNCFLNNIVKFRSFVLTGLFVLLFSPQLFAEETASDKPEVEVVLIKNVRLIDREGGSGDQIVSILIVNRKLDIVTKDIVAEEGVSLVIDAHQGVLLGDLTIGDPATFMIFNEDPRTNKKLLLDTKTHTYLAIDEGDVILNRYQDMASVEPPPASSKKPKKSGWLAYTPPPQTLLSTYPGSKKWNTWDNDYFNGVLLGALLLDRQNWLSQNSDSKLQVGELGAYDGGEIRALRLGVVGQLKFATPWVYTFFIASNSFDKGFEEKDLDRVVLFDYRLDIPLSQKNTLSVGKQKEPISMERLMGLSDLPMTERAAVSDALFPARNFGVVINGNAFSQRLTWATGIFNDWYETDSNFSEADHQIVGRVTGLPILSRDDSEGSLVHLGFGVRYSDGNEGLQYRTDPEFNKAPVFTDTGLFSANSTMTYNLETTLRRGPLWLAGEFTRTDIDAPQLNDPTMSGYHLTLSWILTGEMRPYRKTSGIMGPIPVAKPVRHGGWGAWEAAIRWSELDMNDELLSGGDMDVLSLGLNWYLSTNARIFLNYRNINLDKDDLKGESHGFMMRFLVML